MYKIEKVKMSKKEAFEKVKDVLETKNYEFANPEEIQYGLQTKVLKDGTDLGYIRIFETKKRGTSFDLSQINKMEERNSIWTLINNILNGGGIGKIELPKTFYLRGELREPVKNEIIDKYIGKIELSKPSPYQDYVFKINGVTITQFKSGKLLIQGKPSILSDEIYRIIKKFYEEKSSEELIKAVSKELEKPSDFELLKKEMEEYKVDIEKYINNDLFEFLYPNDRSDLRDAIILLEWAKKNKIPFKNYAIIIRNFSIVFEGFLIKSLIKLGLIVESEYEKSVKCGTVGSFIIIQSDGESQFTRNFKSKFERSCPQLGTKLDSQWKEFRDRPLHSDSKSPYIIETLERAERKIMENLDTIKEFFSVFIDDLTREDINKTEIYNSCIGTDESGKGDYFGPLVIAGVYVNSDEKQKLNSLNVRDSKTLSDKQILKIAEEIKKNCKYNIVAMSPLKYNELYRDIKNLNKMLAWGHARVIENLLKIVNCSYVISDQFGDESFIKNALMRRGKKIVLEQRPRAEENIIVAAASILARAEFLTKLNKMSKEYNMDFPKGASDAVENIGSVFIKKYGKERLKEVAKIHFKTSENIK